MIQRYSSGQGQVIELGQENAGFENFLYLTLHGHDGNLTARYVPF